MRLKRWFGSLFPIRQVGNTARFFTKLALMIKVNVIRSIRLQLIVAFCVCLAASTFVYAGGKLFFGKINRAPILDYRPGIEEVNSQARQIASYIKNANASYEGITQYIDRAVSFSHNKVLLVDLDGKVFFKTPGATETQVDVHDLISSAMESRYLDISESKAYTSFYPVDIQGEKAYLVLMGIPQPEIEYVRGTSPLSLLFAIASFILLFYLLTKRKMGYIEHLAKGILEISRGNLHHRVEQRSQDELGSLASNINRMAGALEHTILEERRAERTKNELITNVSHDLRTPLTLIMGYLRLLKDRHYEDEKQAQTYIGVAYSKSEKLKRLIDDLFEYTKLSNQGARLNEERVCLNELLEQLTEELVTMMEDNGLALVRDLPSERVFVSIDPGKIIRVFENLLSNAVKYSYKPGTIKVQMFREPENVTVMITNFGDPIPEEELPRLFERFYRTDPSRTSDTGGSGLGLAIAKSIIDSHNGDIWAESKGNEIRFSVRLNLASN